MELLGLGGGALVATFVAFGGAVLALYMLKLRRRTVVVPHLALWTQLLADRKTNALWSRLKRWWSLLLALCIVALLVFALADPRRAFDASGRSVVILIDASASMQARNAGRSRLDAARREARHVVDAMQAADRALIAQLDDGVTPLSQLTDDRDVLRAAVDAVQPTDLRADLLAGVRFAHDVLLDAERPEIVVISDGGLAARARAEDLLRAPGAPHLRYVAVGESTSENLGITAFSVRRYPLDKTHSEVLLRAHNYSEREVEAELTLSADGGRVLHRQPLRIPAGADTQVILKDVPGADRTLTAHLESDGLRDALAADDSAYARLPARQRLRIATVSDGNRYLEAALLLDEYLQVTAVPPGGSLPSDELDAVIYDGWLPSAPPELPALYLAPRETDVDGYLPVETTGNLQHPFVGQVLEDDPLTRFTALRDVNIGSALRLRPGREDRVVVRAEGDAPLLVAGTRHGLPFVVLAFHPSASDLPMRVAWPLLVLNALQYLAGEGTEYRSNQRAGEARQLDVPQGVERVEVQGPAGSRRIVAAYDGQISLSATRAGLYRITAPGFEDVAAVNLASDQEGALRVAQTLGATPAEKLSPASPSATRVLWPWLVAIALALLSLEWLTFHRRWTV